MKNRNLYPFIFTKKVNNDYKLVPFNRTYDNVGKTKYLPPVAKEWKNTVYHYNNNSVNFPVYDLNVNSLIKGYFSLYFKNKLLKSKYISRKKIRKSYNKIFVSKAEIKHTNNKAIITIYIYNREWLVLKQSIKNMKSYLKSLFSYWLKLYKTSNYSIKKFVELRNELGNKLEDKLHKLGLLDSIKVRRSTYIKIQLKPKSAQNLERAYRHLSKKFGSESIFYNKRKSYYMIKRVLLDWLFENNIKSPFFQWAKYRNGDWQHFGLTFQRKGRKMVDIRKKIFTKILNTRRLKLKIQLNKHKLENKFLFKLSGLVSKYYNKKVEFNIVNLKSLANNNDIFTQVLTLKLKKEQSNPVYAMNSLLARVVLPKVNPIIERGRIEKQIDFNLIPNKYKNLSISDIISNKSKYLNNASKDALNNVLAENSTSSFNPSLNQIEKLIVCVNDFINNRPNKSLSINTIEPRKFENIKKEYYSEIANKNYQLRKNFIFDNIKYKNMAGAKFIVKGRLTRRYRADRALYKYKWKGGLKNIDSAFKGLSSVVFRGYLDSNVEKSRYGSKRRIGSYGVRSWLAGK